MADKGYDKLAHDIIELVGGKDNIESLTHCVTRLRFKLKDESLAQSEKLEALDEVLKVVSVQGQYQVVVGPDVYDIYQYVAGKAGLATEVEFDEEPEETVEATVGSDPAPEQSPSMVDAISDASDVVAAAPQGALIDLISGIVAPTLGVLASTGMIKGLLALWDFISVQLTGTGITQMGFYTVIYAICDGFWMYLPVMVGFTSARKFKMNEFIGASLGAAMCYPSITSLARAAYAGGEGVRYLFEGTLFQMPYVETFFGIPLVTPTSASGYTASMVPVILVCWVASHFYKWANEHFPATIKLFAVPMFTLLLGGILGFLFVGPISTLAMNLISTGYLILQNVPVVGGAVAGAVLGAVWQVLVIFGFHWALVPIKLQNMATYGFDFALPPQFGCTWAQIAVVLVVILKSKDEEVTKTGVAAFITGLFGTTEPAIYGITLPRKLPFILSCVAGAVSGALVGFLNCKSFIMGYSGILGLTSYIDARTPEQVAMVPVDSPLYTPPQGITHMLIALVGVATAFILGFVLTWLFWNPPKKKTA